MTAAVRRTGRVVDADGRPAAGALVVVVAGPRPWPEIALQVDAAGRFALTLPPGRWTVRAHGGASGAATGEAVLDVVPDPDGLDAPELVIALARP